MQSKERIGREWNRTIKLMKKECERHSCENERDIKSHRQKEKKRERERERERESRRRARLLTERRRDRRAPRSKTSPRYLVIRFGGLKSSKGW